MDRENGNELRESIVARILKMDDDTLRQLHAFISGLEAKGSQWEDERDDSGWAVISH